VQNSSFSPKSFICHAVGQTGTLVSCTADKFYLKSLKLVLEKLKIKKSNIKKNERS